MAAMIRGLAFAATVTVLALRAGNDHDVPPPGRTAAEALSRTKIGQYAAYLPALEAAYRVGSVVVDRVIADWATYRERPPAPAAGR